MIIAIKVGSLALSVALLYGSQAVLCAGLAHAQDHRIQDGRGRFLDSRYNHGHYYPVLGGSYANDVYYTWDPKQNGYVVVDPPANADQPSPPPASAADDLIIYPKHGEDQKQQAADRYDCHSWSKTQSGFDPTQAGGAVAPDKQASGRDAYNRVMSACLTGREYEVR